MELSKYTVTRDDTGLIVVDIQSRLLAAMYHQEKVIRGITQLIKSANIFNLPIILTEHYPQLLGKTIDEVNSILSDYTLIKKRTFDCCRIDEFNHMVKKLNKKYLILTGLETHICIFQTAIGLIEQGYTVHIPHDAVSSRAMDNWQVGLNMMRDVGAVITTAETIMFQLLGTAEAKEFKEILRIVK